MVALTVQKSQLKVVKINAVRMKAVKTVVATRKAEDLAAVVDLNSFLPQIPLTLKA